MQILNYFAFFQDSCVSVCVDKFAKVNQRLMTTYVEVQSSINEKRMIEYENQIKEADAAALAAQQQQLEQVQEVEPVAETSN